MYSTKTAGCQPIAALLLLQPAWPSNLQMLELNSPPLQPPRFGQNEILGNAPLSRYRRNGLKEIIQIAHYRWRIT